MMPFTLRKLWSDFWQNHQTSSTDILIARGGTVALVAALFTVALNTAVFVRDLSAAAAPLTREVVTQRQLPRSSDAHRPPPPPPFLGSLTSNAVYLWQTGEQPRPLVRHRIDSVQPLASITKLMTALVVLDHSPEWDREVIFESGDRRGGAKTPLNPGDRLTIRDLWTMSLLGSDNDATAALVRSVGMGDTIVVAMNEKARTLGMTDTVFTEPTGLSRSNIGSARDVARLGVAALAHDVIRDTLSPFDTMVTISGEAHRVFSSDQSIKEQGRADEAWEFVSGKTGFIAESGYNAVVAGRAGDRQYVLVLMGGSSSSTRAAEAATLMRWAAALSSSE